MKFSEIEQQQWDELQPYLDTCLLPLTGLKGGEAPGEATHELEKLRDALELVEIPFKGRVVTYPAWHYIGNAEDLEQVCERFKASGFRFVILLTANELDLSTPQAADLFIHPDSEGNFPESPAVKAAVSEMWQNNK
ncbi:DUF2487 family protein [Paenibacillaceae bacterium]|nr:DUF2487 family protein [Paenibacillaceae bacterium]